MDCPEKTYRDELYKRHKKIADDFIEAYKGLGISASEAAESLKRICLSIDKIKKAESQKQKIDKNRLRHSRKSKW